MKKLQIKLRSRTGASITFALLLFMVCAVAGSLVLVAGTASAGRISRLAEADQRYYSVVSAAELMRDTFDGKTAAVVQVGGDSEPTIMIDDEICFQNTSLLADASYVVSQRLSIPSSEGEQPRQLSLSVGDKSALNATIMETLQGDTLTLDVSNADTSKGTYTLRLTFTADAATTTDTRKDVLTDETTVTHTTRVTWSLADIQTVTSEAEP